MFDSELLYGLVRLPWWGYALVVYGGIQVMFLGITLFLHREQSHGALELHPVLRHFFRFWLWFCSGTVTKEWVAVHRRHHAYSDQPGDPHSPVVFGLKKVVLEGYELYAEGARNQEILTNYGKGTPDDWIERHLYSRFPKLGIVLFCFTNIALFGIFSILMVAIQLVAQPFFAAGIINGVGHAWGYRSYEMASTATNIIPWGLFIAGEELHNNHHAFPWSARFSLQKWEFDMGWLFICIFSAVGLCKVKRVAPRPHFAKKAEPDVETIQALFTNRMHVLRDYGRRVVKPVAREVARRESGSEEVVTSSWVSKLLIRHPATLSEDSLRSLKALLARHKELQSIQEFRERLAQLWNDANHARAVERLREWCAQAEGSGIRALREFASRLPAYVQEPHQA
jgi:stearoyl-CoA desaturase (delta-9 desaturase)